MNSKNRMPDASRLLRLGFVGGGNGAFIGEVHANGARLSNRWAVVAGALSSDPQRGLNSAKQWHIEPDRSYENYEEMAVKESIRPDGIDAVAIVTPNHLHYPIAKKFLEHGIDIISDKPLTSTLEDAEKLVKLQRDSGLFFGVTYSFSGHSMVRQAREMIRTGMIGDIRQIHVEYFQDWAIELKESDSSNNWRLNPKLGGESFTVSDIGTHAAHLATFVSGLEIKSVRSQFYSSGQPKSLEDTAFMHLKFANDALGTLMVSQAAAGTQCGLKLRVFGSKAGIEWDQENPEFVRFTPINSPAQVYSRGYGGGMLPDGERLVRMPRGHPEALTDAWGNLYTEFAVAIDARRNGKTLPFGLLCCPDVLDGLKGVKFVQASIESNRSGQWVNCATVFD